MLLNTTDRANFVTIGKDRLSVTYHGHGSHAHDVGAVRSEAPFPTGAAHRGSTVHYFEVEIVEIGTRNCIAVGLATGDFSLMRFPGCERHSYGYHGDDGRLYIDGGRGDAYGPRFRRGDVIGCGVQLERNALFFTRNGALLSVVSLALAPSLYAVIALHSPGESVRVNFGATPFRFDVAEMIASLEQNRTQHVSSMQLSDFGVRQTIRHHLLFHAHESTLCAFDAVLPASVVSINSDDTSSTAVSTAAVASASSMQADEPSSALDARSLYIPTFAELSSSLALRVQLRAAVVAGEIEQTALPLLRKHWPELLELASFQGMLQQLRYQAFIERLRGGDLVAAVAYARAELTVYRGVDHAATLRSQIGQNESSRTFIVALPTVLGLLAYSDVRESPLQVLFGAARRQWLARCLNERVVSQQCNAVATASALEVAKRQEASTERQLDLRRASANKR